MDINQGIAAASQALWATEPHQVQSVSYCTTTQPCTVTLYPTVHRWHCTPGVYSPSTQPVCSYSQTLRLQYLCSYSGPCSHARVWPPVTVHGAVHCTVSSGLQWHCTVRTAVMCACTLYRVQWHVQYAKLYVRTRVQASVSFWEGSSHLAKWSLSLGPQMQSRRFDFFTSREICYTGHIIYCHHTLVESQPKIMSFTIFLVWKIAPGKQCHGFDFCVTRNILNWGLYLQVCFFCRVKTPKEKHRMWSLKRKDEAQNVNCTSRFQQHCPWKDY